MSLTLLLLVSPLGALAGVVHVPGDFPTIQQGIDYAAIDDTVLVEPGWYAENVVYSKHIHLIGRVGADSTTIAAVRQIPVITCDVGGGGSIEGFTLRDGKGYFNGDFRYGGGVLCFSDTLLIRGNLLTANQADLGGAISSFWSATIENNTIAANRGILGGGGIHMYYFSSPQIVGNVIAENLGGGIYNEGGSTTDPYIAYNDIWHNVGKNYGECNSDTGDISADPRFVKATHQDYHLKPYSPCVDSGNPLQLDEDGTRRDMGAFPFDHLLVVDVEAETTRLDPGDTLRGTATFINRTAVPQTFVAAPALVYPDSTVRFFRSWDLTLAPGDTLRRSGGHRIPLTMSPGGYSLQVWIGVPGSLFYDEDGFIFTVLDDSTFSKPGD